MNFKWDDEKKEEFDWPFNSQDLIIQIFSNSPYCLPYSSCDVSLENLVFPADYLWIIC